MRHIALRRRRAIVLVVPIEGALRNIGPITGILGLGGGMADSEHALPQRATELYLPRSVRHSILGTLSHNLRERREEASVKRVASGDSLTKPYSAAQL